MAVRGGDGGGGGHGFGDLRWPAVPTTGPPPSCTFTLYGLTARPIVHALKLPARRSTAHR